MEIYLDSLDSFYTIKHEPEPKQNKDYAGTAAIIFTFTVMSIVIGLSIYTAWQIAFGYQEASGNTANNNSLVIGYNDMEPRLKPNDTVTYSNLTLFDNLKVGEIIVFRAPDAKTEDGKPKVIVHRVAEISDFYEQPVIRTKGDANTYSIAGTDYPIFRDNYIGKVLSVTNNNNTTILAVDNQTDVRTFDDCYNEIMRLTALDFLFLPEKNLTLTDIPKYQTVAKNMCNFYHEKTGVWINLLNPDPNIFTEQNGMEFIQRYGDEIPQEFWTIQPNKIGR